MVNNKKLRTPYGMEFFWPDTKMDKSGYINNTTSIYNYSIQGLATAEIIPITLVLFWHLTRDLNIMVVNTVHDSIISKVHKNAVDEYKELSVYCFTTGVYAFLKEVYNYQFQVPLGCGIKVATHWGDTKEELSFDVYPDGRITTKEK